MGGIDLTTAMAPDTEPIMLENPTWVMGHKNPDTDAICSAIAYADFLRKTRIPDAVPACCGPPNARTEWVLAQAGIRRPRQMSDVYPTALQICKKELVTATKDMTIMEAYQLMTDNSFRNLPVVDEGNRFLGLLSLQDLLSLLLPPTGKGESAREVRTTTNNIARILGAEIVHLTDQCHEDTDFLMMVAGSSEPVMQERMSRIPSDRLLLITGDRLGVQLQAVEAGVRALVVTSGFRPSDAIINAAKANGTAILVAPTDTASTTQLIRGARSINAAISTDLLTLSPRTRLKAIKDGVAKHPRQSLFPVVDEDQFLFGAISRTDLVTPVKTNLVLVDHNEFSQAVTGADEANIIEVIDHHRLSGNLVTKEPIRFINKTVGSTCTIVGNSYRTHGVQPSKGVATCICAGIISDTLLLTSPTTTEEDAIILEWASQIAEIDVDEFKEGFFTAGSVLRTCAAPEAVGTDRKEFEENGYKLSISQVEEIGFDYFWPSREALQEELRHLMESRGLDFACLMVTDITLNDSLLLIEAPEEILKSIAYPEKDKNLFVLKGVVSRKKQLFPYIASVLADVPVSL